MKNKIINIILQAKLLHLSILFSFILLTSCGTIIKYKQINAPHSTNLDYRIVALDGMGLVLFLIPGVIAFSIDYMSGTLFLPNQTLTKLDNMNPETIKNVLAENNIIINLSEIKNAKEIAYQTSKHY